MPHGTPKVSIGLPVHNGENFLAEAIDSILAQTYADWELVISDNGSTDRTAEICREYAAQDARIRYHRVEQNQGVAWNFNRVFELSTGEYFKWAAHDDLNAPQHLERLVAVLDQNPEVVLAGFQAAVIDTEGYLVATDGNRRSDDCELQGVSRTQEERRRRNTSSPVPWRRYYGVLLNSRRCFEIFALMRASMLRQTQLMGPYSGSEKVLLSEVALRGAFAEVPEILFFNRWHDARFSADTSARGQREYFSGRRARRFMLPFECRCLWGFFLTIFRPRLSLWPRLACCLVFVRFLFQIGKWPRTLRRLLLGAGYGVSLPENVRQLARHPNMPPRSTGPSPRPVAQAEV